MLSTRKSERNFFNLKKNKVGPKVIFTPPTSHSVFVQCVTTAVLLSNGLTEYEKIEQLRSVAAGNRKRTHFYKKRTSKRDFFT
jgi:hypothetical protein